MKHNIVNGKWVPEAGTFVRVDNSKIPEIIQMLRHNEQDINVFFKHHFQDNVVVFENGGWYTSVYGIQDKSKEMALSDFMSLVSLKLPESWCIQCTEEATKHEAYGRFILNNSVPINGGYLGSNNGAMTWDITSFGDQITIETWAALNPVEENKELKKLSAELVTEYFDLIPAYSGFYQHKFITEKCAQIAVEYAEKENTELRQLLKESVDEIIKLKHHYKDIGHGLKYIYKVEQLLKSR